MTVTSSIDADVRTTGDTVTGRFTVKNLPTIDLDEARKPLFAVVGVADLAIEQVKELPALYAAEAKKAQERAAVVPTAVKRASEQATDLYAKLALRGERLVTSIRRQPATQAAIAEGKEAVRKAEASATAARKSVKAGEKAVEDAAAKLG